MQYHLDTIPVWEVMKQKTPCPICALYQRAEQMEITHILGGSIMEPSSRIRVNELGFCAEHDRQLLAQNNKLGHALLTDSHCTELVKKLGQFSKQSLGKGTGLRQRFGTSRETPLDTLAAQLDALTKTCIICDTIETHMNRYLYTFMHLWKTETRFVEVWHESKGACLPHTVVLLQHAAKHLPTKKQQEFADSAMTLLQQTLSEDQKDLKWFLQKFDYRNQDQPWENSKDALERTLTLLHGRLSGEKPAHTK